MDLKVREVKGREVGRTYEGIPRLVHKCIEEVELRGMKVVGIYRLCGPAIVKRELRKKLEESKDEVSLAADDYPDVNVITGILKDFLRELPQPLFPPELLEAVTLLMENNTEPTQLSSMSPSPHPPQKPANPENPLDRERKSDMLLRHISTLCSMQVAEKCTLYALLNHLKKVALHHPTNKMNCQNLAVCFGPVLLGPTTSTTGIDITGAIGFKRHIQVLNYMLTNWPEQPILYKPSQSEQQNDSRVQMKESEEVKASSMKRVSLTRRLSRKISEGVGEDEDEKLNDRSTIISLISYHQSGKHS